MDQPGVNDGSLASGATAGAKSSGSFVPQPLLDAADAKIATWSSAVIDAADTVERLVSSESLPIPEPVRELITSTSQKLRNLGSTASERDAADLVADLQRRAASHPAAAIGIGAAVGAALATLLVRLGSPTTPATTSPRSNRHSAADRRAAPSAANQT